MVNCWGFSFWTVVKRLIRLFTANPKEDMAHADRLREDF